MSKIKIVFLDIDDTLLYRPDGIEQYIPPENIEVIKKIREKGIHVVLTTGRALPMAMITAKKAELDDDYLITTSGGLLTKNEEIIVDNLISSESLEIINKFIIENNLYAQYFHGFNYFIDKHNEHTDYYEKMANIHPIDIGKDVYQMKDIRRIIVATKDKELFNKTIDLVKEMKDIGYLLFWNDWIEIDSYLSTKGNAIKKLCQLLNVDLKETMGIGDETNDIPMWDVVGYPVVMGQAKDELKKGRIVTDTVQNAGVAKILRKYCLDEEN